MASSAAQPRISAVYIVKNEEDVLARSLASVAWADEVVVYDTGSTDSTREIAARFTDRVIEGYWDDDFGAARNRAIAHANGQWVLVVDADERFEGDPDNVRQHLGSDRATLWTVPVTSTDGHRESVDGPNVSVRVFRRGDFGYRGRLHEQVVPLREGAPVAIQALPNARLVHSGYVAEAMEKHAKKDRNLRLALAELEAARGEGADPVAVDVLRANLARSYVMAGEYQQGLSLAHDVVTAGRIPGGTWSQLATSALGAALELRDDDEASFWLEQWRTHDYSPVWATSTEARLAAGRGDARRTLELLDTLPTTVVDRAGRRFVKHDLADVVVWALVEVSRWSDAARFALDAARAGRTSVRATALVRLLRRTRRPLDDVLAVMTPTVWRQYALWAAAEGTDEGVELLRAMLERRPGDLSALVCSARASASRSLAEAAESAAAIRRAGLAEHCPLLQLARDTDRGARDRALAAAMVVGIYGDRTGLEPLEGALAEVPAHQEREVLAELDIVAPGLVTAATG